MGRDNVKYYPENGCPGPEEIQLGNDVVLILFDSQWWLHRYDKPGLASNCSCNTKEEVLARMEEMVARNRKKLVLVASHHPMKSNSIHGGYYTWKQHIFPLTDMKKYLYIPLPVIGSIYPVARSVFGIRQDLKHPLYASMISRMQEAVKSHPNIVFVAGHDHSLQLLKDSSYNYIVSGSGSKSSRVKKGRSLYAAKSTGFCVMEVSVNKNVTVSFYSVSKTSVRKNFSTTLLNFYKIQYPVNAY